MLTQTELAKALGKDRKQVRRWVAEGMPRVGDGPDACYDLDAVRVWIARSGKDKAPGRTKAPKPAKEPDPVVALGRAVERAVADTEKPLPDAPTAAEERKLSLEARSRSWMTTVLAVRDVQRRLLSGRMDPSPTQVKALADAAKALSEAVRGDAGDDAKPATLKEALVEALLQWLAQWGEPGFEALVAEVRAIAAAPE